MQGAPSTTPIHKDLVLLGGGHSHLFVLYMFGMKPEPGVRVTLISRDIHTPYSGMLPGYVAGHYTYDDCHIDLAMLAQWAGVRFIHAEAQGLDLEKQLILLKHRPPIRYDVLSINLGITPDLAAIPGAGDYATPVKPIFSFVQRVDGLLARARESVEPPRIAVVGGGAGGVELALALAHRLKHERRGSKKEGGVEGQGDAEIRLITRGPILPTSPPYARTAILPILQQAGVMLLEGAGVRELQQNMIILDSEKIKGEEAQHSGGSRGGAVVHNGHGHGHNGYGAVHNGNAHTADGDGSRRVCVDEVLLCTQAAAPQWLRETGLPLDKHGFIAILDTLQVAGGPPNVFACGDCATSVNHPRPKAGVFAVRQGPPLAANLRAALTHTPLQPFIPQTSFLSLISTGAQHAVGTKGSWLGVQGNWVWTLKDWIDRGFMNKFGRDLPLHKSMSPAATTTTTKTPQGVGEVLRAKAAMRCGGCGSKVGGTLLAKVLSSLPGVSDDGDKKKNVGNVLVGVGDDAAVVRAPPQGHVLVQTVDFMRAFVSDPFVFGAVVANHCLSDCFAMGASPQSALAIVGVPFAGDVQVEEDVRAMLQGALSVLEPAGCALVGGHTSEVSELCLGFAINGTAPEDQLMTSHALRAGDVLVLTKPIGTGMIFAAAMRRATKGRHVQSALNSMLQPNDKAVQVFSKHGVRAATDVTGFGLLGHAIKMAQASGVALEIDASAVPRLPGVDEVGGIRSSLYDDNLALVCEAGVAGDDVVPVLVDPQTSGGLLAGVPAGAVDAVVEELRAAGYTHAAVVGRVVERNEGTAVSVVV